MARGTALTNTVRQVAGSFGVAIMSTLLQERGESLRNAAVRGLPQGSTAYRAAATHATVMAFHEAYIVAAVAMIPAALAAVLLRSGRVTVEDTGSESAAAAVIEGAG
jgi:hypothetical protein